MTNERLAECENMTCAFCQLSIRKDDKIYCDALIETVKQGERCRFFKLKKGETHDET